jgi:hypothetical protein
MQGSREMNGYQKAIALGAIALVVFLLLYPPWYTAMTTGRQRIDINRGYRFINNPPPGGGRIDYPRYLGAVGAACVIAALAMLETRRGVPRRDSDDKGGPRPR